MSDSAAERLSKQGRIAVVGCAVTLLSLQACGAPEPMPAQTPTNAASTSAPTTGGAGAPAAQSTDACGLHLYGSSYDPTCQWTLDQTCCKEEISCAGYPDCKSLVACTSACPHAKGKETESCIGACIPKGEKTPGFALFDRIATCSKKMPPTGGKCDWP